MNNYLIVVLVVSLLLFVVIGMNLLQAMVLLFGFALSRTAAAVACGPWPPAASHHL
jgi:hypothetical protein